MPNVIQLLRSSTAGARPAAKLAGEAFLNFADLQFGASDGTATRDLIAVRFFSATGIYAIGDHVIQAGLLYRCITAVTVPGAFVPASWELAGGTAPDLTPYLLLAGGTMVGPLVLAADPVADMEAATMGYVLDGLALRLPLTAGPTAPLTGQLHLPAALPTLDAEATSKLYVDAADTLLQDQIDVLGTNLLFVGSLAVTTDVGDYSAASALVDGPLPVADATNANMYVIITDGGTPPAGNIPAGSYAAADWLVSNGTAWVHLPIGPAAVIAPNVAMSPVVGALGANVQLAITALEAAKLNLAGGTMTGALVLSGPPTLPLHPVSLAYLQTTTLDAGTY